MAVAIPPIRPPLRPLRFWLIGIALFGTAVWLLSSVLLPFVAGAVIAYVLDPVADRLERAGVRRWIGALCLVVLATLVVVLLVVAFVPLLVSQIIGLAQALPNYVDIFRRELVALFEELRPLLERAGIRDVDDTLENQAPSIVELIGNIAGGVWQGSRAIVDVLTLLGITPVVAFYLLRDWDLILGKIDQYLPRQHAPTIRLLAGDVNHTLANFMRGQAAVCIILGTFYAIALSVAGLNFSLVVGFGAGIISVIPYFGAIVGLVASVGIAIVQFDSYAMVAIVAGIFVFGQAVEGNVLTPKALVGDSVGLHPVWVIFALMASGSLFGFTGLLIAVPLAAVLGVVARFFLDRYRDSGYYRGLSGGPPADADADADEGDAAAAKPAARTTAPHLDRPVPAPAAHHRRSVPGKFHHRHRQPPCL